MDDELDPGHVSNTQPANALPFVVALVGFVIVATLAFLFLREDADLSVVRPDSIDVVDDTTIRLSAQAPGSCAEVRRAQVDMTDDDRVFVELIVDTSDCSGDQTSDEIGVEVVLPEPIDDRGVVPGVGRVELPCSSGTCRAEQ